MVTTSYIKYLQTNNVDFMTVKNFHPWSWQGTLHPFDFALGHLLRADHSGFFIRKVSTHKCAGRMYDVYVLFLIFLITMKTIMNHILVHKSTTSPMVLG